MTLASAIRLGALRNPPCFGDYARLNRDGVLCTDPIFAALRGCGVTHLLPVMRKPADYLAKLVRAYPVMKRYARCPLEDECGSNGVGPRTVDAVMCHLVDEHGFSREAVSEWVESVEGRDG